MFPVAGYVAKINMAIQQPTSETGALMIGKTGALICKAKHTLEALTGSKPNLSNLHIFDISVMHAHRMQRN